MLVVQWLSSLNIRYGLSIRPRQAAGRVGVVRSMTLAGQGKLAAARIVAAQDRGLEGATRGAAAGRFCAARP